MVHLQVLECWYLELQAVASSAGPGRGVEGAGLKTTALQLPVQSRAQHSMVPGAWGTALGCGTLKCLVLGDWGLRRLLPGTVTPLEGFYITQLRIIALEVSLTFASCFLSQTGNNIKQLHVVCNSLFHWFDCLLSLLDSGICSRWFSKVTCTWRQPASSKVMLIFFQGSILFGWQFGWVDTMAAEQFLNRCCQSVFIRNCIKSEACTQA